MKHSIAIRPEIIFNLMVLRQNAPLLGWECNPVDHSRLIYIKSRCAKSSLPAGICRWNMVLGICRRWRQGQHCAAQPHATEVSLKGKCVLTAIIIKQKWRKWSYCPLYNPLLLQTCSCSPTQTVFNLLSGFRIWVLQTALFSMQIIWTGQGWSVQIVVLCTPTLVRLWNPPQLLRVPLRNLFWINVDSCKTKGLRSRTAKASGRRSIQTRGSGSRSPGGGIDEQLDTEQLRNQNPYILCRKLLENNQN